MASSRVSAPLPADDAGVCADAEIPVQALGEHFAGRLGADASIAAVSVASEGMSDDTWIVDVATARGLEQLVVRRYRSGGALREETDSQRHFRVLRSIPREQVPVPEALWFEADPEVVGGPFFVMRRVAGRIVVPWSSEGRAFLLEAGRGRLGVCFIATLAKIHALPWRGAALEFLAGESPEQADDDATRRITAMRAAIERYKAEPEPVLLDALGWLEANKPAQGRTTVVHGDYRTGNIVFGESAINAVLDWEFARIGDPTADLAWMLGRTNRIGSNLACYILERERALELYHEHAGWVPSAHSLRFWEVVNLLFNTGLWLSGEHNYLRGRTRNLALARWSFTLPSMRKMVLDALEGA